MKRLYGIGLGAGILALGSASLLAGDFDPTGKAGQVSDTVLSEVIYGPGAPLTVNRWIPWALPSSGSGLNNSVVQVVNGQILGGVSTFSSTGNPQQVAYFGTVDALDSNGFLSSNNVFLDEFPYADGRSNTIGQMLSDGRLFYRANFDSAPFLQNNMETYLGNVFNQVNSPPGNQTEMFLPLDPNTQLGLPAAISNGTGGFYLGITAFAGGGSLGITGANIWNYTGSPLDIATPTYVYTQSAAEAYINGIAPGTVTPAADCRQSPPAFARVQNVRYVIFGIGDTNDAGQGSTAGSGGRRPKALVFDVFEDNDGFNGAVALFPPAGQTFVSNQATGGGSEPFENKHFDMNSSGTMVVLTELRDATDPNNLVLASYFLRVYTPTFAAGRISGFNAPVTIADAGPAGTINDGIITVGNFEAISAPGINENGDIVFTANYDDNGTPRSAVYMYQSTNGTLHRLTRQDDLVGTGPQIRLGAFPQTGSDSFFGTAQADSGSVIATCFRDKLDINDFDANTRGVIVLEAVGGSTPCPEDCSGDGQRNQADLAQLLSCYNQSACCDINGDGITDQADLAALLAVYNTPCP